MRNALRWTLFGCVAMAVAGCNAVANPQMRTGTEAWASARTSYGQYALRPSDQLRIKVYNEDSISGDYQVDSAGFISIPLAGRVRAGGRTTAQLEQAIASQLNRGVIKNPRVNVQISSHAPFYIHGEVKRAGEFPYRPGLTVSDAVATAGGFTYRANEQHAFVRRAGANAEIIYSLAARVPIYPGDNIRIPERFF
jgi:polysaccharide biosynthesis/export protein